MESVVRIAGGSIARHCASGPENLHIPNRERMVDTEENCAIGDRPPGLRSKRNVCTRRHERTPDPRFSGAMGRQGAAREWRGQEDWNEAGREVYPLV